MASTLHDKLERNRSALASFLRRQGSGLLRFEEVDDLVQGVFARALAAADEYEDRGEEAFLSWLYTLARRHVATRHAHWQALKRGAGRVLRLTLSGGTRSGGAAGVGSVPVPATRSAGPRTFAESREQLVLAIKALDTLPERDRQLVRWTTEGVSVAEQAERLELSYEAAQRAGHRALERFRQAFRVLTAAGRTG